MDATLPSSKPSLAEPTTGSTAASVLEEFCRMMGIPPFSKEEAANLPPWTEEEAAAFERHINEAFEQIEDTEHRL